jgi:hypothetical protein
MKLVLEPVVVVFVVVLVAARMMAEWTLLWTVARWLVKRRDINDPSLGG